MSEHETVWIVEVGVYSDRYICGVYRTAEAAMAANHREGENWREIGGEFGSGWENGLDWEHAMTLWELPILG